MKTREETIVIASGNAGKILEIREVPPAAVKNFPPCILRRRKRVAGGGF